jgi:hypothetical protein
MASSSAASVRLIYRELIHHAKQTPKPQQSLSELRASFRKPLDEEKALEDRLKEAESRLSFLRMTTKTTRRKESGTWVYKDGQRLTVEKGTLRDAKGKVISSFDGKNLDPESVSRHRKSLKRAGFTNNQHAKGFF